MALKKKFIDIQIPLIHEEHSALGSIESLKGKTIKMDMTRRMRGKGLEIVFYIKEDQGTLVAVPKRMFLIKSYIMRIMRKSTSYVEDSFFTETSDGIRVAVKPFLITRKKVSRAVRNHLRVEAKNLFMNYIKEKEYMELCMEIYSGTIQKAILPKLKKIYPLAFCDLRVFETKDSEKIKAEKTVIEKRERKREVEEETEERKETEEEEEEKEKKSEETTEEGE